MKINHLNQKLLKVVNAIAFVCFTMFIILVGDPGLTNLGNCLLSICTLVWIVVLALDFIVYIDLD